MTTLGLARELPPGTAPDRVMLFPRPDAKGTIPARDGRTFHMADPSKLVASFNSEGRPVPLDLEHSSELKAPLGDPAPAIAWVTSLELCDGAIFAHVDWTPQGADLVKSHAYRFCSPAFNTDKKTGQVVALVSAALTNRPALTMDPFSIAALARAKELQVNDIVEAHLTADQIAYAKKAGVTVATLEAGIRYEAELAAASGYDSPVPKFNGTKYPVVQSDPNAGPAHATPIINDTSNRLVARVEGDDPEYDTLPAAARSVLDNMGISATEARRRGLGFLIDQLK